MQNLTLTHVAEVVFGSGAEDDLGGRVDLKGDVIISNVIDLVVVAENSKGNPRSRSTRHFSPALPKPTRLGPNRTCGRA